MPSTTTPSGTAAPALSLTTHKYPAPVAFRSAEPQPLTAAEQRILAAFRAMDERSKYEMRNEMDRRAHAYPVRRPTTLRLVAGGAA